MSDPYMDFLRHENEMEDALERCPVCDWCGERIQDEFMYIIGGDKVCEHCIEEARVYTSDYEE